MEIGNRRAIANLRHCSASRQDFMISGFCEAAVLFGGVTTPHRSVPASDAISAT